MVEICEKSPSDSWGLGGLECQTQSWDRWQASKGRAQRVIDRKVSAGEAVAPDTGSHCLVYGTIVDISRH